MSERFYMKEMHVYQNTIGHANKFLQLFSAKKKKKQDIQISEIRESYLEEVEFSIIECTIIILIRYFEYTSKGFYTGWFHL